MLKGCGVESVQTVGGVSCKFLQSFHKIFLLDFSIMLVSALAPQP